MALYSSDPYAFNRALSGARAAAAAPPSSSTLLQQRAPSATRRPSLVDSTSTVRYQLSPFGNGATTHAASSSTSAYSVHRIRDASPNVTPSQRSAQLAHLT